MATKPENTEQEHQIYLFSINLSSIGIDKRWYFYSATSSINTVITSTFTEVGGIELEGISFYPAIISIANIKADSSGKYPRPKLSIAVMDENIAEILKTYDLVGGGLTYNIRYTENGALTEENYDNGYFIIYRKSSESRFYAEFELMIPFDMGNDKLPKRVITSTTCTWVYKSKECGWAALPGTGYNAADIKVGINDDICGKRITSCKVRFGKNPLPFGGFPLIAS
jgi:lambda family phage minor tail protein L